MSALTKTREWIRTHVVASIALAGGLLLLGSGGAAVAVAGSGTPLIPSFAETADPTATPSSTPAAGDEADPITGENSSGTPSAGGSSNAGGQPNSSPGSSAPSAPAPPAPPAAPEPEPVPAPDAPSGISISSDGSGGFYVTWNTPEMYGATLDHYWIDVTDPGYTHGDRTTSYGNSMSGYNSGDTNCVVIAAVTTTGVQGDAAGPVCY